MKAYLMDGYIVCTDEVITGALLEWELTPLQAELVNAGGTATYADGVLTIKPAPPVVEEVQSAGLTKLEFMNRFTDQELATMRWASYPNCPFEPKRRIFMKLKTP